jgi:hypothetical protein
MMACVQPGNTKGGSTIVPLTSCLTGLESPLWILTVFVFIYKTGKSSPVKQEVNGTVILSPSVFPGAAETAAYLATVIIYSRNFLPNQNVIKLFMAVSYDFSLMPCKPFQNSTVFVGNAGAYPNETPFGCSTLG